MGFVYNALLGPFLVYMALMGHVVYHHFYTEPPPISLQEFPASISQTARDAIVKGRNTMFKHHLAAYAGKSDGAYYISKFLTTGVTFEDPTMRLEGTGDMSTIFRVCEKYVDSNDYEIRGEYHGPNEIVLDLTMNIVMDVFGTKVGPLSLPMRQHLLLETVDGAERIFAVREDWGGNVVMNEDSLHWFRPLGKVHKMLRGYTGFMAIKMMKAIVG